MLLYVNAKLFFCTFLNLLLIIAEHTPVGNTTSARRLYVVNPGLEVDRTDLNVQEMSIHEPDLTVGNSTSTRRLNLVKPAIEHI